MQTGAIILCGGRSSRMGRDKSSLPFGPETMLQRVVRLVGEIVDVERIVVVAAPSQEVPEMSREVIIARDADEFFGPLAGMAVGLNALGKRFKGVDAVYLTGCDAPLLVPAFIERLISLLGDSDAVVPIESDQRHVLAAVYRPQVLEQVERLLAIKQFRLQSLLDEINARKVGADELRAVDPSLSSLRNVNSQAEYRAALEIMGITAK
jgi:molybdopterin-guanine dinucleotide biosynthesis protein A